jgi:hypothetical protein
MQVDEIRSYLHDDSAIVRSHAIEAMTGRIGSNSELLREVLDAIVDAVNSTRLMGTVSVAHVGLRHLFAASESTKKAARELVATWPASERDDLLWFLKSAGIQLS